MVRFSLKHHYTSDTTSPFSYDFISLIVSDSLGGNAKTVMVANIGPASYNFDETVTTLR